MTSVKTSASSTATRVTTSLYDTSVSMSQTVLSPFKPKSDSDGDVKAHYREQSESVPPPPAPGLVAADDSIPPANPAETANMSTDSAALNPVDAKIIVVEPVPNADSALEQLAQVSGASAEPALTDPATADPTLTQTTATVGGSVGDAAVGGSVGDAAVGGSVGDAAVGAEASSAPVEEEANAKASEAKADAAKPMAFLLGKIRVVASSVSSLKDGVSSGASAALNNTTAAAGNLTSSVKGVSGAVLARSSAAATSMLDGASSLSTSVTSSVKGATNVAVTTVRSTTDKVSLSVKSNTDFVTSTVLERGGSYIATMEAKEPTEVGVWTKRWFVLSREDHLLHFASEREAEAFLFVLMHGNAKSKESNSMLKKVKLELTKASVTSVDRLSVPFPLKETLPACNVTVAGQTSNVGSASAELSSPDVNVYCAQAVPTTIDVNLARVFKLTSPTPCPTASGLMRIRSLISTDTDYYLRVPEAHDSRSSNPDEAKVWTTRLQLIINLQNYYANGNDRFDAPSQEKSSENRHETANASQREEPVAPESTAALSS